MIDFKYTQQNSDRSQIEYVNDKGEVVTKLDFDPFESWVNKTNYGFDMRELTANEQQTLSDLIDLNWVELTEAYYNELKQHGFKSNNTYSQKGQILC